MPAAAPEALLDETGREIIEALQRDGRTSYAKIARRVGLSEAAVRQRVGRLVSSGVVQIVAVTDPTKLGHHRAALIGVVVTGDVEEVSGHLEALDESVYVVSTAGSFDLLVEVVCRDDAHLLHVVNEKFRSLPGVLRCEIFLYLDIRKQTYSWESR